MEIVVKTERYTAQELQHHINGTNLLCVVMPGDQPNEYAVVVDNEGVAMLVRGMLKHLGAEEVKAQFDEKQGE
jgi:hypothetical protein